MSYVLLPDQLRETADRVKAFLQKEQGLRKVQIEAAIDDSINWRPTLSGATSDHHIVCVEVTSGGYTNAFDHAVIQCTTAGLPVRFYIAYSDDEMTGEHFRKTFDNARMRGVGIIEVKGKTCTIVHRAVELSLASVRRVDRPRLKQKYRQAFSDAEETFLGGDPPKGCLRVFEELETLSRKFVQKGNAEGWWNPAFKQKQIDGPWATLMMEVVKQMDSSLSKIKKDCPKFDASLITTIHGLTKQRNESGHKPKTRAALIKRDRELRTRFEHAVDVFMDFQDATSSLRL